MSGVRFEVASLNEKRERERGRKDNVFGSRRDIYQLCTLPERKTKRIYSVHLSLERLIAERTMFQRQRTETEGLCSSVRKTFVKVCGSRDICTTDFLFFPPLHSNLTRGNKSWANPSSGNRARISRGHRQGKRRCSLDRGEGGRAENKNPNRMFFHECW